LTQNLDFELGSVLRRAQKAKIFACGGLKQQNLLPAAGLKGKIFRLQFIFFSPFWVSEKYPKWPILTKK